MIFTVKQFCTEFIQTIYSIYTNVEAYLFDRKKCELFVAVF